MQARLFDPDRKSGGEFLFNYIVHVLVYILQKLFGEFLVWVEANISYSRKFGGWELNLADSNLVVCLHNCQIEICQSFLCVYVRVYMCMWWSCTEQPN